VTDHGGLRNGPVDGRAWVNQVVGELRRSLADDASAPDDDLLSVLVRLQRCNLAQWRLEDESRRPGAADDAIGRTKRDIDVLNARRHRLVEEIDAAIDAGVSQAGAAPPSTESPAMALDRLTVLLIRVHQTELMTGSATDPAAHEARLAVLHAQLATLEEALAVLLDEVRAGARRFVPYRSAKLYHV
jgi:hypothetical protein